MASDMADKPVQFIVKLVQLTQDGKLRWKSARSPEQDRAKTGPGAFVAEIDGRRLRLYKAKREIVYNPLSGFIFSPPEEPRTRIIQISVLEVLDEFDQAAYSFEDMTGLNDLYEAAAYSASKVADLMDAVLARD
jgi:hypothetical protein